MPTTQRARGYQKTPRMTAEEKKQRDAEAAAVWRFLDKVPNVQLKASQAMPRFMKIKETIDGRQAAAMYIQQVWRGLAAMRAAVAQRVAMTAEKKEAAAAADEQRVKDQLEAELARLIAGLRLSSAAVLRGDKAKLQSMYGPAASMITRAMQALVRMCRARKAVTMRLAEVELEAQAARQAEAKAAAKAAKLAARKAAAGAALKAAAQKERALVLEQLCDEAGSNSREPWCV